MPAEIDRRRMLAALSAYGSFAALSTFPVGVARADFGPLPESITDPLFHSRAIEAMVWAMPAVNLELMEQAKTQTTGMGQNSIVYWSNVLDWKGQLLTPNSDVIYSLPFWDLRQGPMVLEIPPIGDGIINGSLMNAWQAPFEDVGPEGLDQGEGGRYLFLPPDWTGEVPDGYFAFRSSTVTGYALMRSVRRSGSAEDLSRAVEYMRRIRLYPFSLANNPPQTNWADAFGKVYDATIPYGWRLFEHINRFVQREPWLERDRAMIDTLRTIGIEKGTPFSPDSRQKAMLDSAAIEAGTFLDALFARNFELPYAPGANWAFPTSPKFLQNVLPDFPEPSIYMLDERGFFFTAMFSVPRRPGDGIFWLWTIEDASGQPLEGNATYQLRLPPNPPANRFWSITLYDRKTHAFIRNAAFTNRSSQTPGLQQNDDGSIDIYMGPSTPPGLEANWIPTDPAARFTAMARFYGPEAALFDKSWILPSIDRIQ
jgi:hypothetical protein